MTYKYEIYQGFENDPTGTLSESLVSAWSLTELAGPRRDSAGSLDLRTTSDTRFNSSAGTPNTGISTGVLHPDDKFVVQFEGPATGSGTTNYDKMLFAPLGYNYGDRSACSFAAWCYIDSTMAATGNDGVIVSHLNYDWLDGWYVLQIESGGNQRIGLYFVAGATYSGLLSTTNLSTSTWYHLAWTWDGTNRTIYINGASNVTDTDSAFGIADNSAALCFGRASHDTYPHTWHGRMCHAALWKKELSAAEVTTLYNSGVPNRYKPWKGE